MLILNFWTSTRFFKTLHAVCQSPNKYNIVSFFISFSQGVSLYHYDMHAIIDTSFFLKLIFLFISLLMINCLSSIICLSILVYFLRFLRQDTNILNITFTTRAAHFRLVMKHDNTKNRMIVDVVCNI